MESCIRFCQGNSADNVLLVYLLYRTSIVSSMLHGNDNANFWRFHSGTVSLACAMRLDAMSDSSIQDRLISKQSERRLFTAIYVLDKAAAFFAGRSPLLASHRGTTALPLDISNAILVRWEAGNSAEFDSLGIDDHTSGRIYPTTSLRARGLIARIREDILAIALNMRQRNPLELM
ncbi:hypothetical protein BBK36DRAFT_23957 [Trichoderma citrinoviride]|uniref:Xylanolytic transcriptional activator regulatory domain-containing protein n=1 Tax=Trichoderma citrinoviride TaxID=58853 RepID=A0A2T4AYE8_9HYPO|nr:hypothetical protein BBK36DRAFT_23957 [Trichoderma citrinoviride]PTB62105.1 hypothetical protein BBK36DRAFT_23957 [Trichoderma citrinoviride]